MDQQPINPYQPQQDPSLAPVPYQGSYGYAPQQGYQQPYGTPQPDPAQAAWQQPYQVPPQPQYGYQDPQAAQMPVYQQPVYAAPTQPVNPQEAHGQQTRSGLAVAGLVIGIVSLVLSPVPIINNFAWLMAVVGMFLAGFARWNISKKENVTGKKMAVAGGILSLLAFIIVLASQATYSAVLDEAMENLEATSSPSVTSTAPSSSSSSSSGSSSSSSTPGATSSDASSASASAAKDQDMPLGTAASFTDGITVTVVSATPGLAKRDCTAVTGITVEYKNNGSKNVTFASYDWKAEDPQGAQRSQTFYYDSESPLSSGQLAPGGTVTGNLYFEDPIAKIVYSPSWYTSTNDVSWLLS